MNGYTVIEEEGGFILDYHLLFDCQEALPFRICVGVSIPKTLWERGSVYYITVFQSTQTRRELLKEQQGDLYCFLSHWSSIQFSGAEFNQHFVQGLDFEVSCLRCGSWFIFLWLQIRHRFFLPELFTQLIVFLLILALMIQCYL